MKINQIFTKGFINSNKGNKDMTASSNLPENLTDIISGLEQSKKTVEAIDFLDNQVKSGNLSKKNGVLFKTDDYTIQTMLKFYSEPYLSGMQKIAELNLSSAPKLIKTVDINNDSVYIISQIPGTKTGDLIPYSQAKHLVSKEDKLAAFKDIQKVLQSGIIDNNIAQGKLWFVTPDDHKIMFPSWEALRPLDSGEDRKVLNNVHELLFAQ